MINIKKVLGIILLISMLLLSYGCGNNLWQANVAIESETVAKTTEVTIAANETFVAETTEAIEPTETIVETEPNIPETEPVTEPEETILLTPDGDEIIRVLHLEIDSLSIREGPGAEHPLLDSYRRGEEILVIDETSNGWLKVYFIDYNDEEKIGYCFNGYRYFKESCDDSIGLDVENPVETVSDDEIYTRLALENLGTYGRLLIPRVDISCQLNLVDPESDEASYMAQHYTDIEDSAAFFKYGNMYVISDHREQGFANLEDVTTNDIAYIGSEENVIKLYCYKTQYGKNTSDILLTDHNENGTGFDGYLIYTFSDTKDGFDIYMTYWRKKTW